jgi:glycosyltransferase involved in cell wall biosynthesis
VRIAFVLDDDAPGATARHASGLARELRDAGHLVETFSVVQTETLPFPGHPGTVEGLRPIGEALRSGARYDASAAFGWTAFYAMFLVPAGARVHFDTGEEWRSSQAATTDLVLIERAFRTPGPALITTHPARRAALARELGREALVLPVFVDGEVFSPARRDRSAGPRRVLIDAGGSAGAEAARRAVRIARQVGGLEVWQLGSDRVAGAERGASRVLAPAPAEGLAAVLRACDAMLAPRVEGLARLAVLEAMACGLVVVAGDPAEGSDLLRDEVNAVVVDAGDEGACTAALERVVRDGDLRARLAAGALETAAACERAALGPLAAGVFLRAVNAAGAWREESERELAAIGDLLRRLPGAGARPGRRPARPPSPPRPGGLRAATRALVRRALSPVLSAARSQRASRPGSAGERAPGAGEPVVFVGQRDYFRAAYADAIRAGWGLAYAVRPTERAFDDLPGLVETTGARTCVVFEPWLLAARPAVIAGLRAQGARLVAYSTEPLPGTNGSRAHWDQLRRLDDLRRARDAGYQLWIHHDPASEGFLRSEGFEPLAVHPLPVSEALFHPEAVPRDFDACFLGWSTPHREAWLSVLRSRYRTVHVAHGMFDEEARRLMNRSKLVVNLHCHDYPNFENRCVQALFCGRPLVSEELSGGYLTPGDDYLLARSPAEMLAHARRVIEGGGGLPSRPRFDRSKFLVSSLRALLSGSAATP